MTNITAEQRLALARAVYPILKCTEYQGCVYFDLKSHDELFEPEENAEQLLDVLCWLLKQDCCNSVDDDAVRAYPKGADEPKAIEHNCTPASLSDAVVRAAVMVVEGE